MATKYYQSDKGSIYKVSDIVFNTGENGTEIKRFNWDFNNWNGHQHNHEQTRKDINSLNKMTLISENEVLQIINPNN